jgi:hypothetical protein
MLFNLVVMILMALAFAVEEMLPAIQILQNVRLFHAAVFFFAASVAVPLPTMLIMAFFTGYVWDARYLMLPGRDSSVEQLASAGIGDISSFSATLTGGNMDLAFGYSILIFGVLGLLMQGIRPLFKKGRWELPVLMVGVATAMWLIIQYLLINFLHGGFVFTTAVCYKIITTVMFAMLAAPLLYLMLHILARLTNYEIKYEGLRYRFDGR